MIRSTDTEAIVTAHEYPGREVKSRESGSSFEYAGPHPVELEVDGDLWIGGSVEIVDPDGTVRAQIFPQNALKWFLRLQPQSMDYALEVGWTTRRIEDAA